MIEFNNSKFRNDSLRRKFYDGSLWLCPSFSFLDDKGNSSWEIVRTAMDLVRYIANDNKITDSKAIELICSDFLAGPMSPPNIKGIRSNKIKFDPIVRMKKDAD